MAAHRSVSFPPRSDPTNPTDFEAHLQKLKSCEIPVLALTGLADLYETSARELARSPAGVEESLSRSVELLDACIAIEDILRMLREKIQALQSALRRKGPDHSALRNDVASYLSFRRRTNKLAAKTLKNFEKRGSGDALGELTGVTVAILRAILVNFLSGPGSRPGGGWAFVSKVMMNFKPAKNNNCDVINELERVDFALGEINKSNNDVTVVDVNRELRNLETMVEGLEGGVERLFRQLLRFRVILLNVLTANYN